MDKIKRIFVEKKADFAIEAKALLKDLTENLNIKGLEQVRIIHRYDVSGITDEVFSMAVNTIFSEPPVDTFTLESMVFGKGERVFAVEYLPGQYDQRADSAAQSIQILSKADKPKVKTAKLIVLRGTVSDEDFDRIVSYCINPVESQLADLAKPDTLELEAPVPEDIRILDGFIELDDAGLSEMIKDMGLAMDFADIKFCQRYFRDTAKRNPTYTEIKIIDTYWSDHCRHTTFSTELTGFSISDKLIEETFQDYLKTREDMGRTKKITLMDLATICVKELSRKGYLDDLDKSEEINACSIKIDVKVDGKTEPWLLMFKNETHNHPTEIEPFGGAATCLGGAIRDPLSGRSYVYQAMRVTGSGDVREKVKDTMPGKLPQRKISTTAAQGYSSYGNQIGLATGMVREIYDEGYKAKRMEIGAVIGAAPVENVIREIPAPGDVVILLGGRTGRDGCGGATGSSKAHTAESLETCGAEVQKGNPPEERKIQRLFRDKKVTTLIKRCNDFGAGGVSVAIGELADGLTIDLDKVLKKYDGLDGTELAISESQERMAVVVRAGDAEQFIKYAHEENLEAVIVAEVTEEPVMTMKWRGKTIVDITRYFLNSNGAPKQMEVAVEKIGDISAYFDGEPITAKENFDRLISNINICSQKGLIERFDSSIGAGSVLMPFGGKYQLTPSEVMAAKIPVLDGECGTASVMSYGYDPALSKISPYHGSVYAVVESIAKLVAAGCDYQSARLTFQEYFERLGNDPKRWGKPFAALLGAYRAQMEFKTAAIGGKDSMSGSFDDLDVPPTLVSFAVNTVDADKIISNEMKRTDSRVYCIKAEYDENDLPDFERLRQNFDFVHKLAEKGVVLSAHTVTRGGIAEAIFKMCAGNKIGFTFETTEDLGRPLYGSIVIETTQQLAPAEHVVLIGHTKPEQNIDFGTFQADLNESISVWEQPLSGIFPIDAPCEQLDITNGLYENVTIAKHPEQFAKPRVFIPVFPGTNCEYDTARVFEKAGAQADVFVLNNIDSQGIKDSIRTMKEKIENAQMIMIPGGFSGGDEPEGSGKFIATVFRNPEICESVNELLYSRDGLMLGICNGFQALIKLGLVPFGKITETDSTFPTLTFNTINRHVSCMVNTKIISNKSPWLYNTKPGDMHSIAVSHGEGRFVCSPEIYQMLSENGQIATQYVDFEGNPTYDIAFNPNGSYYAIEGITSADGRIFGKMGHSERYSSGVFQNIYGEKDQKLFESGVQYFK